MKISLQLARQLVLDAQFLDSQTTIPGGKEGVFKTIDGLGYVQIDTIAVIRRAHHHTLWTRRADYRSEMLHELQTKDRRIFEYWGHAMSYLPISDYRYYLPKMRNFENPVSNWAKFSLQKCGHLMQPVLERIRNEGPLAAKDFAAPPDRKGGTWWDWKPAKIALEMLFWKGDLMITERKNFQKIYDLTERVLPEDIDTTMPNNEELGYFFVRRALSAYGLAKEKKIRGFMQPEASRDSDIQSASGEIISQSLAEMVENGEITPISLEGEDDSAYYALSQRVKTIDQLEQAGFYVHLLSPFDNFIIQRERIKRLFNFEYALECYLPEAKRKYGYFVLPVLWGTDFVGRLDPKADRKNSTLIIRNLIFEPQFEQYDDLLPLLANKLVEFARFNQCEKIEFENISSKIKIKASLKRLIKKLN